MRLGVNVTTQKTELVLKEGVFIKNDFLDREAFEKFLNNVIKERKERLLIYLDYMENAINQGNKDKFYKAWEMFYDRIFRNKDYAVTLFFIENINGTAKDYTFKQALERNVITKSGLLSGMRKLQGFFDKSQTQEALAQHLENFMNGLSQNFGKEYNDIIKNEMGSKIRQNFILARKKYYSSNKTDNSMFNYKDIIYGRQSTWHGKAADAFMNHMAHYHVQVLAGMMSPDDKEEFSQSVFAEEGSNIFYTLRDSLNNTTWTTGGDVMARFNGETYNFQIKTKIKNSKSSKLGNTIATKEALSVIRQLKDLINNTVTQKEAIDYLYEKLATSGWVEPTNQAIVDTIEELTEGLKI